MKNTDYEKQERDQGSNEPRHPAAGKIAKDEGEERAAYEDDSARVPILTTDFIKNTFPASQARDLLVELN